MPEILNCKVNNISMSEAIELAEGFIAEKKAAHIVTLNAEIAYMAQSDKKLLDIINKAALVTPDGSGIVWAAEKLGQPLKERVTGVDLTEGICKKAAQKGYKMFFLGSKEGVAAEAARALQKKYTGLNVAGTYHGFFLKEENGFEKVLSLLEKAEPDILLVAMGAPKQEFVITEMLEKLHCVVMGVGGSFDVFAGRVKRAPRLIQKMRLEWLWRTILQPSRWKRTLRLPLFMHAVKKQAKKQCSET